PPRWKPCPPAGPCAVRRRLGAAHCMQCPSRVTRDILRVVKPDPVPMVALGTAEEPRPLRGLIPVAPRVLREQVRDALRDAILSATLQPGTRIGEVETA